VFRRFGTRARNFAAPLDRLIAYGRARTGFLIGHSDIARASLDGHKPIPAGRENLVQRVCRP